MRNFLPGISGTLTVALALIIPALPARAYSTHQDASVVIGQPDMFSNTSNNGGRSARSLAQPHGVSSDGTKLAIGETNHRVLIFNSIPNTDFTPADVVVGQPDFTSGAANQGGNPAANTMNYPHDVYLAAGRLFVAEQDNNRVTIFNPVPMVNNAAADVILGQPSGNTNLANNGGLGPNTLDYPEGVFCDGTRLFIADTRNNRILIYSSLPTVTGSSADLVIGQPDGNTNTANYGGLSARTLDSPYRVYGDGTSLWVADLGNARVLFFNSVPSSNFANADLVLGQPDFTTNDSDHGGLGPAGLDGPKSVYASAGRLFIGDNWNNRVLVFASLPTANFTAADAVLGQPNMVTDTANNGGLSAASLDYPCGVFAQGSTLWVADATNHRVLRYDDPTPTSTPTPSATPTRTWGPSATATPSASLGFSATVTPRTDAVLLQISSPLVRLGRGECVRLTVCPARPGRVQVSVYDLTGRRMVRLIDADLPAGPRELSWDCAGAGSGTYIIYLDASGDKARGKIVLLR